MKKDINDLFKNQIKNKLVVTEEYLNLIPIKHYYNGDNINIGDYVLEALLITERPTIFNITKDRHIMELILITEDMLVSFKSHEFLNEKNIYQLPVLELK